MLDRSQQANDGKKGPASLSPSIGRFDLQPMLVDDQKSRRSPR